MNDAVVKRALEALAGIGAATVPASSVPGNVSGTEGAVEPSHVPAAIPAGALAGEPGASARRDEYWHRASQALDRISRLGKLVEALTWLEQAQPARHRWLRVALPAHLGMLWEAKAPLHQFQDALEQWLAGHAEAVRDWLAGPERAGGSRW